MQSGTARTGAVRRRPDWCSPAWCSPALSLSVRLRLERETRTVAVRHRPDWCSPVRRSPGRVQSGIFGRDLFSSARRDTTVCDTCKPARRENEYIDSKPMQISTFKDRVSVRPGRKTIIMWVNWEGLVFRLRRGMRGRLNRNLGGRGGECGACLTVTWEVGEENAGPA